MVLFLLFLCAIFLRRAPDQPNTLFYCEICGSRWWRYLKPGQRYLWPLECIRCSTHYGSSQFELKCRLRFPTEDWYARAVVRVHHFELRVWYITNPASVIEFPPKSEVKQMVDAINRFTSNLDSGSSHATLNETFRRPIAFSPHFSASIFFTDMARTWEALDT